VQYQGPRHPDTVECLIRLDWLRISEGKYPEALAEALRLEKLADAGNEALHLDAQHLLGESYIRAGKFPTAIQLYAGMLQALRRTHAPDSPEVTDALSSLAAAYEGDRQFPKGAEQREPLVKLLQARLGPEHPETLATRSRLAADLTEMKQWDEAEKTLREIAAAYAHLRGPDHPDTLAAMNSLAGVLRASGRAADALPVSQEVYARRLKVLGPDHPDTIAAMSYVAAAYEYLHQFDKSTPLFLRVYEDRRRVLGPEHTSTLVSLMNLGVEYSKRKEWPAAETCYRRLWEICKGQKDPIFNNIISAMNGLQATVYKEGRYAEAEAIQKEVLAYRRKVRAFQPSKILEEEVFLADIYYHQKKFDDAQELLEKCLKKENADQLGALPLHMAESLMGGILAHKGKGEEAEPLLETGYRGLEAERPRTIELELNFIDDAKVRWEKKGLD
jgi:non-specific serine/threonine protein kinase/serine/threonine-protein kinase